VWHTPSAYISCSAVALKPSQVNKTRVPWGPTFLNTNPSSRSPSFDVLCLCPCSLLLFEMSEKQEIPIAVESQDEKSGPTEKVVLDDDIPTKKKGKGGKDVDPDELSPEVIK
jgi:hypothetical protein